MIALSMDDAKRGFTLQQELDELKVELERKRSEVSNLVVGYRRAVEGTGAIPAAALKRNLIQAREDLSVLEGRLQELQNTGEAKQGV